MKRVVLFLATNLAVVLLLSVIINVFGLNQWLSANGIDYIGLLVFSAVVGFAGSFISLLMSKTAAKWSTGAQVIDGSEGTTQYWLVNTVKQLAEKAGIGMPEVAVYEGAPNAFATGAFKNSSLVAVSSGLLQSMSKEEVEAVLGHEIGHIANGDMVTLTLIQGVVNTFVVFFSKLFGYFVDRVLLKNDGREGPGIGAFVAEIVAQLVLGVLASVIVMWFSRQREFRADAGGANLAGRQKMIAALEKLKVNHEQAAMPQNMAAMAISSSGGFSKLFMTHPPLDERIEALRSAR